MKNNSLLNYQQCWVDDRSPLKVMAQSREIGVTWATAREAVDVAGLPASDGGMDVYYMATSEDDARLFADYCSEWIGERLAALQIQIDTIDSHLDRSQRLVAIPRRDRIQQGVPITEMFFAAAVRASQLHRGAPASVRVFRIELASGFAIHSIGGPALVHGKGGYHIIADAAWQDIEARLQTCSGSLLWGGRAAIISSYSGGVRNEFYQYIQKVKASIVEGKPIASLHEIFIVDALRDGLYKRICEVRNLEWSEEAEAEWLAEIRRHVGQTFAEEFAGIIDTDSTARSDA